MTTAEQARLDGVDHELAEIKRELKEVVTQLQTLTVQLEAQRMVRRMMWGAIGALLTALGVATGMIVALLDHLR